MDTQLATILTQLAIGAGANLSSSAILAAINSIFNSNPEIETKLSNPSSKEEFESALSELAGNLELLAGSGEIAIDGVIIEVFKSANFDHQSGLITVGNTVVSAATIQTGGTGNGKTILGGNTQLKSQGTSIEIGGGASIIINGNASIRQG